MNNKIGFIGAGNMGSAIIKSLVKSEGFDKNNIFVYEVNEEKAKEICTETGINLSKDINELVKNVEVVLLAVKPNILENVLNSIKNSFVKEIDNKLLVSIAVGIPISFYRKILGESSKIVRCMPNTPALVGEGMTLISYDNILETEVNLVKAIFECTGKVEVLPEKYMSEVTALTGSSPAYVYMFIEAMADAAVLSGLPRDLSYRLAAQAVLGSAKMVLETKKHPGELKDQVCSPAGTTIEAVACLEKEGFRNSIICAMNACTKRAKEIGKQIEGK